MYSATYGDQLLFDPRDPDRQLTDQEVDLTLNEAGTYTFTMPPTHPLAGGLELMNRAQEVVLYRNGAVVFRGRVISDEEDFRGSRTYTCEGERAYLNDAALPKYYVGAYDGDAPEGQEVDGTLDALFTFYLSRYNARVPDSQVVASGENQGLMVYSGAVSFQDSSRDSVWSAMKSHLIDAYGGYVRMRYDGGVRYMDYLAGGDHVCGQVVEFGKNLLDLLRTRDGSSIVTRVVPVGKTVEVSHQEPVKDEDGNPEYDEDGNPKTEKVVDVEAGQDVTIEDVPDGPLIEGFFKSCDAVVSAEDELAHGIIEKVVEFSDCSDPNQLVDLAYREILSCAMGDELELSAIDLSLLDSSVDALTPGDYVRVVSGPHGLDRYMVCQSATLHPDAPDTDTYTLGIGGSGLTQVQESRLAELDGTITEYVKREVTAVGRDVSAVAATAGKAQEQAAAAATVASGAATTAQTAQDATDKLSTLIRDTGEGVEVAKVTSAGAYSGVRALLTADALKFLSTAGSTLAEFGANVKTAGLKLFGGVATLLAGDKTVTVSDKEQATITGLDIKAPFVSVSGGDYLAEMGTSTTINGYDVSATLKTGSISGYYGTAQHTCVLGSYKMKTGEQHSAVLTLSSAAGANVTAVDGTESCALGVTSQGVRGGGKALYASKVALATGVTAYRHMGWVVVAFNNWVTSSAIGGANVRVGTLAAGYRPPEVMKGALFAGSADYSAMANVSTAGVVQVYSANLPANQQVSGYVIYPATQ